MEEYDSCESLCSSSPVRAPKSQLDVIQQEDAGTYQRKMLHAQRQ